MGIGKEITELQDKIGYKFADLKFLETAVTHSSYSNEQKSRGHAFLSNERLEFLGDAVLQIVISKFLYENYKEQAEGSLTKMRQILVCEKTLSKIAAEINLGDYINLGRGEEMTACRNRPKILADTLEAVFGAVFIDSNSDENIYGPVILNLLLSEIENAYKSQKGDYKTLLQQLVEKDGTATLCYEVVEENGPEHDKEFTVVAKVNNNIVGKGISKSKKGAEMKAAKVALSLFGVKL